MLKRSLACLSEELDEPRKPKKCGRNSFTETLSSSNALNSSEKEPTNGSNAGFYLKLFISARQLRPSHGRMPIAEL